ncbi:hypothetical protein JCM17823_06490 [Halorubrum gandharaense]
MSVDITRGGLLVALAVFGVIAYELRTVAELFGMSVPLIPYLTAVIVLALILVYVVIINGGWRTDTGTDEVS